MGFFGKVQEWVFTGKIIKDYGVISKYRLSIANVTIRAYLSEKNGKKWLVLRSGVFAGFGGSIRYVFIDKKDVPTLKKAIDDIVKRN